MSKKYLKSRRPADNVPVLSTKLYTPPVNPTLVRRERLISLLNKITEYKLMIISAPAGFGKTTLLCDWINQSNLSAAWYTISKFDNDVMQFLSHIIAALQTLEKRIGNEMFSKLYSSGLYSLDRMMTSLINDICVYQQHFILVLEDYHNIENIQIHKLIEFMLNHNPPHMHLIIATRSDPYLPLARMRSNNQMLELRAIDLSFTKEEVCAYLNDRMKLNLSTRNIEMLESRTEGWAAGLQMAALSLKNQKDPTSFINAFAGNDRHIMDYLSEQVLNNQTDFIRSFLLQTSILDRLSASLCDAVTVQSNSQQTLQDLETENLFIIPLDNKRIWYRYHHLFSDLLNIHLNQTMSDKIQTLHARAGKWFDENNQIDQAINHYLAAHDFKKAALLTENTFFNRMGNGEDFTIMLKRLDALPENIVRNSPVLSIMHAYMFSITLQLDKVEPRLLEIEDIFESQLTEDLERQIALIRADLARHNSELDKSISISMKILESIPDDKSMTDMQTLTGCLINLAWAFYSKGNMVDAAHFFSESLKICRDANSTTLILLCLRGVGLTRMWKGKLNEGSKILEREILKHEHAVHINGQIFPAAAYVYITLAELLLEQNRLEEANSYLCKGIKLGEQTQVDCETLRDGYIIQSRLKQATGDMSAALDYLKNTEPLEKDNQCVTGFIVPRELCWARLMIARATTDDADLDSNIEAVQHWLDSRSLNSDAIVGSIFQEFEYLIRIRILIIKNEIGQALQLINRLYKQAMVSGRIKSVIEILILQSLVLQKSGDTSASFQTIQKALGLAAQDNIIRIFLDEGQPMMELLQNFKNSAMLKSGEPNDKLINNFIKKLLVEFRVSLIPKKQSNLIDQLSYRELEVLRFIEAGLTNMEIGEHLFISLNTVRTHCKNINSKLKVHSRTMAVVKAKELGLI